MLKPLTVWITTNYGEFLKKWEYQTTLPVSWGTCMQVKKQQLKVDIDQWTDWKLGKQYIVTGYFCAEYIMWNAGLDESQAVIKLQVEIWITSDMQMTLS